MTTLSSHQSRRHGEMRASHGPPRNLFTLATPKEPPRGVGWARASPGSLRPALPCLRKHRHQNTLQYQRRYRQHAFPGTANGSLRHANAQPPDATPTHRLKPSADTRLCDPAFRTSQAHSISLACVKAATLPHPPLLNALHMLRLDPLLGNYPQATGAIIPSAATGP